MRHRGHIVIIMILAIWGVCAPMWQAFQCTEQRIRTMFADETTGEFDRLVNVGESEESADLDDLIEAIRNYYPSGTKQVIRSRLDRIVERSRMQSIALLQEIKKRRQQSQ